MGDVEPGGPGDKAGLKSGDVILDLDGEAIDDAHELPRVVARHAPGAKVAMKVLRNKSTISLNAVLDPLKDEAPTDEDPSSAAPMPNAVPGSYGLVLGDSPGGGARVQRVQPGGAADELLAPGDIILEVNHQAVVNPSEAIKLLKAAPQGSVLVKVRRENTTQYVGIERK